MNMRRFSLRILFSLSCLGCLACLVCFGLTEGAERTEVTKVTDLIKWLPTNTESLWVAQGPIIIPAEPAFEREGYSMAEVLTDQAVFPLLCLHESKWLEMFAGKKLECSVAGARNFRAPKGGLGLMPYDGCHILEFADDLGEMGETFFRDLRPFAKKVERIEGYDVYIVEEEWEADVWQIHIVQVRGKTLVVGTDTVFVGEVLKRVNGVRESRALPDTLPEWKSVDRNAKFWGLRHYDRTLAATDPSSPLLGRRAASMVGDQAAVGVTFRYDPAGENVKLQVRYHSPNKNVDTLWTERLRPVANDVSVRRVSADVVELSFEVSDRRTVNILHTFLLALFGHGIFT